MVRLENIAKRYDAAPILSDISFDFEPGGFYWLTGAGGAGKSTLLRIISLAERPSGGRLRLFDVDPWALRRDRLALLRRRIGILFQEPRLLDELSVRDNAALPLRIAGAAERDIRDNVPELLAWVGLAARADVAAGSLSGGERQLLCVARAIVGRPDLLVADEPAGMFDDQTVSLLMRIFERINRIGTTVVIATRDVAFAARSAHRRLHLDGGTLTEPDLLEAAS